MSKKTEKDNKAVLDDLVSKVWHIRPPECENYDVYKQVVGLIVQNLEMVLDMLAKLEPPDSRVRRSMESVAQQAVSLREMCRAAPEALHSPEDWQYVKNIMLNYDMFRDAAGRLYRLVVPGTPFEVLGPAL